LTLTHDDYEWVSPIIKTAAGQLARRWPGIERDDIEQEIWVRLLPDFEKLDADPDYVGRCAYNAGRGYCSNERYYYTLKTAEWVYTPNEVRGLFKEAYFDPCNWLEMPSKETNNSLRAGGVVVALWDLKRAFDALPPQYREVIVKCYRDEPGKGQDPATKKRLQRAIDKATRYLNQRLAAPGDGED
jgi:DNA-directed RNA polymerase specialized sigma24 family protein